MKRPTLLLFLALLSCAPAAPPPAVVAPALPSLVATSTAQRVVLLSFDGLGADLLARQTGLPAFERLAREGASAHVAGDVDPAVESIIEIARRQGKRVGSVLFPSIDNSTASRSADFGLAWSDPVVRGRVITLGRDDFKGEWVPPGWTPRPQRRTSFSPIRRARLEWSVPPQTRVDVDVVAYDNTDDQTENYDTLFLESGEFETAPDARGWFPISTRVNGVMHGSWSKVLAADRALSEVKIYWGPINRNEAWPASFAALLDEQAGFWPGAPDEKLDPQTFTEQLVRLTEFLTRAQTTAMQRMPSDLLLLHQPVLDIDEHAYAFVAADHALDAIARLIDPARDAFIVTGDDAPHTLLFATGAGVPKGNLGEIPHARIHDFVKALLGLQ